MAITMTRMRHDGRALDREESPSHLFRVLGQAIRAYLRAGVNTSDTPRPAVAAHRTRFDMSASPDNRYPAPADDALGAFRDAIGHHAHDARNIDDLKPALRQFCAAARRAELPPEQLVVLVKRALEELPTSNTDAPAVKEDVRTRLVSLAIRTYYSDSHSDGGHRAG